MVQSWPAILSKHAGTDRADAMTREAHSHELSSVGFWPGAGEVKEAAFYSYTQPEPQGFKQGRVRPEAAFYSTQLGEFLLLYEDVRKAKSPSRFLHSTSAKPPTRRELLLQIGISTDWSGPRVGKEESLMLLNVHLNRIKVTSTDVSVIAHG